MRLCLANILFRSIYLRQEQTDHQAISAAFYPEHSFSHIKNLDETTMGSPPTAVLNAGSLCELQDFQPTSLYEVIRQDWKRVIIIHIAAQARLFSAIVQAVVSC